MADQSTGMIAAQGYYDYYTHFNLTGFDLSTVVITGQWAIDNSGADILINGASTGNSTSDGAWYGFHSFSITSGFVQGDNVLDFHIYEDGSGPTGIRVEMSGTGQLATNPPPAVPPTCNSCGCQGNADLISTAPDLCGSDSSDGYSEAPVRYFDGTVLVGSTDLTSAGFGTSWGQSRSWSNGPGYASASFNGTGTVDSQLPTLLQTNNGNTIIVVSTGTTARYFDSAGGNSFTPRYYDQTTLTYSPTTGQYLLTDTTGNRIVFDGFGSNLPANQRGQLESFTDQAGNVTSVFAHTASGTVQEVRRSITVNNVVTTESYLYTYYPAQLQFAGLLQNVKLRRQVNGGSFSIIRQVAYTYYTDSQSYGNGGDLSQASTQAARASFVGQFYDASDRLVGQVDYGNHGNAFLSSRPSVVAVRGSSPDLLTQYAYLADTEQTVALVGSASGNFQLSFNGQSTAGIPYNASAATVQNALQGIPALVNNVQVYGPSGGPWNVRFSGALAGRQQPLMAGLAIGYTVAVTYSATAGDSGRMQTVTDPRGIITQTDYDLFGRTTRTVAAFNVNPAFSNNWNQVTESAYDGDNHVTLLTAYPGDGTIQQTQYLYNIQNNPISNFLNSYDLLSQVDYPDKSTGRPSTNPADQEFYQYDNLGEVRSLTQRTGTVHTYSFDSLGRPTQDAAGPFGTGVDQTVGSLATAYDTYGNPATLTSYAPNGTTIVNQVQRTFNGLGQLTADAQYHGDPGSMTTPHGTVNYAYNLMAGGANNSRLLNMTYPNGRQVNYLYGAAGSVDNTISRRTGLADNGATFDLEDLSYLGLDTVVQRAHLQSGINLTYIGGTSDANDPYGGLDHFGRVVNQNWFNTGTSLSTDNFAYGYDYDSNRLYQNNLMPGEAALGELYHTSGSVDTYAPLTGALTNAGYDVLNQLNSFSRGTLGGPNFSTVSNPTRTQQWTLDALGNWAGLTTNIPAQNQTRQTNRQNELTQINGSTNLGYDNNGNTTMDDQGNGYVYDAWNRLMQATAGSTTEHFAYDALGRRIQEIEPNSFGDAVTRDLYFSAQWQVLEERETSTSYTNLVRAQYVWSPVYVDALVERERDPARTGSGSLNERLYVQQDANWNVTALVGQSGGTWQVLERYLYDPYGRPTDTTGAQTGASDANWNFRGTSQYGWVYLHQGGRYDTISGLYNFRNRDYSATLGRWMQPDPVGYAAGDTNLYRDVGNDPTSLADPSGLSEEVVLGTVPGPSSAYDKGAFTEFIGVGPVDGMVSYIEREARPLIEYRQVRGSYTEIGAQTWGQPGGGTAYGSGKMLKSGDLDLTGTQTYAKYGGAQSIVGLKGTGDCCNTVIAGQNQSNDAGELIASVHYFKCGTYKFKIKVEYKLVQDVGHVGANLTTRIADQQGKLKQAQTDRTANRRGYRVAQDSRVYDLTINIGASGTATIARVDPRLSGQTGSAKAVGQIWILDIDGPQ